MTGFPGTTTEEILIIDENIRISAFSRSKEMDLKKTIFEKGPKLE
jgi:hypothetical protein